MMQSKENNRETLSPNIKKRVRICSLNQKRKALTQCTLDLNIILTSPSKQATSTPKVINLHKKKKLHTQVQQIQQAKFSQKQKLHTQIQQIQQAQLSQKQIRNKLIKTQNAEDQNKGNYEQFDKLIQITERCVDYYNKFIQIKGSELKVVKQAFNQIHESLNKAFNGIIIQVQNKHRQIREFLQKKQKQLIKIKQDQQKQLNMNLNDVKSVHLINLLTDYKSGDHSTDINEQICNYASTLHKFYETMQKVEKQNFKQGVEDTVNFINNIITEQIKFIVYQKIPTKSLNASFSFNHGLGFANSIHSILQSKYEGDNYQPSIVTDNIQSSLSSRIVAKKKQVKQGWTQTLSFNQSQIPKQSILQKINQITKNQLQMRQKIKYYRQHRD